MATNKQKARLKIIGKARSKKAELLAAGYSLSTATKQPPSVLKAKGWEKLIEAYLPDEKLAITHSEALEANKIHGTDDNFIEIPDHQIRLRAVELGYKVKGRIQHNGQTAVQINFNEHAKKELEEFSK